MIIIIIIIVIILYKRNQVRDILKESFFFIIFIFIIFFFFLIIFSKNDINFRCCLIFASHCATWWLINCMKILFIRIANCLIVAIKEWATQSRCAWIRWFSTAGITALCHENQCDTSLISICCSWLRFVVLVSFTAFIAFADNYLWSDGNFF